MYLALRKVTHIIRALNISILISPILFFMLPTDEECLLRGNEMHLNNAEISFLNL